MEQTMIESIRELFQNFIAPQLESIKGEIKALDSRFEARIDALDSKFEARIDALDTKFVARIDALDAKFEARIDTLDAKFETLDTKVGSFRTELLAEIRRVEGVLSADFVRLEEKVDLRLANMDTQLASTNAIMNARLEAMNERLALYRPLPAEKLRPQRTRK
jgi:phage host-nuclease inhibitor protein Gam